jgi:putative transposase
VVAVSKGVILRAALRRTAVSDKRIVGGRGRYSDEEIKNILAERERGATIAELSRRYGISGTTFYKWRGKFAQPAEGEPVHPEEKNIAALEEENRRLKQLLAEAVLKNAILEERLTKEQGPR